MQHRATSDGYQKVVQRDCDELKPHDNSLRHWHCLRPSEPESDYVRTTREISSKGLELSNGYLILKLCSSSHTARRLLITQCLLSTLDVSGNIRQKIPTNMRPTCSLRRWHKRQPITSKCFKHLSYSKAADTAAQTFTAPIETTSSTSFHSPQRLETLTAMGGWFSYMLRDMQHHKQSNIIDASAQSWDTVDNGASVATWLSSVVTALSVLSGSILIVQNHSVDTLLRRGRAELVRLQKYAAKLTPHERQVIERRKPGYLDELENFMSEYDLSLTPLLQMSYRG